MCWLSPTLSACLRYRTLMGTYSLCGFVRAYCAVLLCCAMLAVLQYSSRWSLPDCLRCRTLIGTYLLCGFVRADSAVLRFACGTAALLRVDRCSTTVLHKKKGPQKQFFGKIWLFINVAGAS